MALTLDDLLNSPDHYLHSFEGEDALFVPMSRAAYHRSIFLDGRILPESEGSMRVPVAMLRGHARPNASTGWIFHVAHCGSTLLARALDTLQTNLVLREPLALRQVAITPDADWLALVTTMLQKRYQRHLPTIVKANVPVNFILPRLMAIDPAAPTIFLYLGLQDYLLAILRSPDHRAWLGRVTQQLAGHLGDLTGLADAERAAALWSAQIQAYAAALPNLDAGRTLNAETFFAEPGRVLAATAKHFAVPFDKPAIDAITAGPLFGSYSKNPSLSFDNAARMARREALLPDLADEIALARSWLDRRSVDVEAALAGLARASLDD